MTSLAALALRALLAAALGAALAASAAASAQTARRPDPCLAPPADLPRAEAEEPRPNPLGAKDQLARDAPGRSRGRGAAADPTAACEDEAKKEKKGRPGRYGDVPGPDFLRDKDTDIRDTMGPPPDAKLLEAQRLRTARTINRQGVQSAQRGDWAGALHLFEIAAQYAPHDRTIQRNILESRARLAREAAERRRRRLEN